MSERSELPTGSLSSGAPTPGGVAERIGPYRLLGRLGEGGFGVVYLAERREPHVQRVALKIIKPGMDSAAVIARFEQERQALAVMDHPHVARVFDAGVTDAGHPYFVMEHVRGEPVTDYCDRNRLTIRERLGLFLPICEAVQHAHSKGLIHRDIKPSNILVAPPPDGGTGEHPAGFPKIIDFGVAKAISQTIGQHTIFTEQGQVVGTPEYMSPEQAEVGATDIDTRSDVYSLGVLLYELLTGALPFDSKTLRSKGYDEVQRIIREVDPPRPCTRLSGHSDRAEVTAKNRRTRPDELASQLRRELEWIPLRALRKERKERYQTPLELADDVRNYLAGRPLVAGPETASYRVRKFVRRNKGPVAAAGSIAALLVVGVVSLAFLYQWAMTERDRAERQAAIATAAEASERARAEELERVAAFQASRLAAVSPDAMGAVLRESLIADVDEALTRAGVVDADRTAQLDAFEATLGYANFTNVALAGVNETLVSETIRAIDANFAEQPLVQARLLMAAGETMESLGLFKSALGAHRRAVALRTAALGPNDEATLLAEHALADALLQAGEVAEADPLLRNALQRAEAEYGPSAGVTLRIVDRLASSLGDRGQFEEAMPLYERAAADLPDAIGADDPVSVQARQNLAFAYAMLGRLDESEALFRAALDDARRALGDTHPVSLLLLDNLGTLLQMTGKADEGGALREIAYDATRTRFGDDHPETIQALIGVGTSLDVQGRLPEAEAIYREALARFEAALGPNHMLTLTALNALGTALGKQGKLDEAGAVLGDAVTRTRASLGEQDPRTARARSNYATYLVNTAQYAAAEREYRAALDIRTQAYGENNPETIVTIQQIAVAMHAQGDAAGAAPLLEDAVARFRAVLGDATPYTVEAMTRLVEVLVELERLDEADVTSAEAVSLASRVFPPGHWQLGGVVLERAHALAAMERHSEAVTLYLSAHETLDGALGPAHRRTNAAIEGLASTYAAWHAAEPDAGHDAEAAQWRARAKAESN